VVIVKEDGVPTDLETTFMSGWKNIWDHGATAKPIILDQYFIPVRREDGSLGAYRINDEMKLNNEENIKDFKKAWYNMLLQVWEKFNTATSQGRPPRWVNVPLNREMIFQLADPKTHSVAVDEFKKAVHSLNEGKKPEKFVAWGAGTKIPPGWMEVGYNPLELHSFWLTVISYT
jgi:hypothetical protein